MNNDDTIPEDIAELRRQLRDGELDFDLFEVASI